MLVLYIMMHVQCTFLISAFLMILHGAETTVSYPQEQAKG